MRTASHIFFDIGGVLGTNGWDHEQRSAAGAHFGLDAADFTNRHAKIVAEWESGRASLDQYLDFTIFHVSRPFTREDFVGFMFAQSLPYWPVIDLVLRTAGAGKTKLFTLNNESEALNVYRIERFGLRRAFEGFLSSCWLGVRKPDSLIFERALGIAQVNAEDSLFLDDREQNLVPARRLGFQVHLFSGDVPALEAALTAAGAL